MPKARVTKLNVKKKVNPIVREHDNTTDLELAEQKAHAALSPIRYPGSATGSFSPQGGTDAYNGKTVTAPPYKSS